MKKSKILGLSLGAVALTTVAVATPVILTSCVDSKPINDDNSLEENVITNIEIKNNAITLSKNPNKDLLLTREKGTNYFNLDVKGRNWNDDDVSYINPSGIPTNWVDKARLIKEGFDKEILDIMEGIVEPGARKLNKAIFVVIGFCDKNGNVYYPMLDKIDENKFAGYNYSKSTLLCNTVKIVQANLTGLGQEDIVIPPNKIEKEITIDFKLTINPNK